MRQFSLRFAVLSCILSLAGVVSHADSVADSFNDAPPSFEAQGKKVVAVDFDTLDLKLRLDVAAKRATGVARVAFKVREAGYPMLDLVPNPTAVALDGQALTVADFALWSTPDGTSKVRVIQRLISDQNTHVLEVAYPLNNNAEDSVKFTAQGAKIGFFTNDLGDRGMLENYAPANFQFDQFRITIEAEVIGGSVAHQIFTNGVVSAMGANHWRVEYPAYFNSDSSYFHVVDGTMAVATGTFEGMTARVPVTAYSSSQALSNKGLTMALAALARHEATFGPFAHASATLFITSDGGFDGGMEYCGATTTDTDALSHELTHSWYARGVQPANGNAGWIDEAVASWQDDNYARASSGPSGAANNMAARGAYIRFTPRTAYTKGMKFLSELDYLFAAKGGLRPMLKEIFARKQRQTITTEEFRAMLEELSQSNLSAAFSKYAFGVGRDATNSEQAADAKFAELVLGHVAHKRPSRAYLLSF